MPYTSSFQNLIQIQSLQNKILEHQKAILDEEKRIVSLNAERKDKQTFLTTLKDDLSLLEQEIAGREKSLEKLQNSIETAKHHLKNASTEKELIALESEIKTWEDEKSVLEESLLEDLGNQETKETELKNTSDFIKGSETTLKDIELEVKNKVSEENAKIEDLKSRMANLLEICEEAVRRSFQEANLRHEFKSPLALIEDNRCSKCQMHLPTSLTQPIESGKVLDFCPNCGRLLIPHSALA